LAADESNVDYQSEFVSLVEALNEDSNTLKWDVVLSVKMQFDNYDSVERTTLAIVSLKPIL
jgi:hypothetical protein